MQTSFGNLKLLIAEAASITTMYRWEESEENALNLIKSFEEGTLSNGGPNRQAGLYVTDDKNSWGSKYASHLVVLRVSIRNPLKIPDDKSLERELKKVLSKARKEGHDAIVSTPNGAHGTRQVLLLEPDVQVKSIELAKKNKPSKDNVAKIKSVKWDQVPPETLEKILKILKSDLVGF